MSIVTIPFLGKNRNKNIDGCTFADETPKNQVMGKHNNKDIHTKTVGIQQDYQIGMEGGVQ